MKELYKKDYQNRKEYFKKYNKKYKTKHKKRLTKQHKKWIEKNRDHIKKYSREYERKKKLNNPEYRIKCFLRDTNRTMINKIQKKILRGKDLITGDLKIYKEWIESQFKEGMSWQNYLVVL